MSEINPLQAAFDENDVEMQAYGALQVVSTFGQPQMEYAAIRNRAAIMDWPQRGIIELTGPDRQLFLDSLVTNTAYDAKSGRILAAGQGAYAFFLTEQGHIITDVHIIERGDRTLLELENRKIDQLHQHLIDHLAHRNVKVTPLVGQLHEMALFGSQSTVVLGALAGVENLVLESHASIELNIIGRKVLVWRNDVTANPGYWLVLASGEVSSFWFDFLAHYNTESEPGKRAVQPTGWAAFNAARIEAGQILFGIDFDEVILPVETGLLDRTVDPEKSGYPGYRAVVRMCSQPVSRRIVGVRMDCDALPLAGSPMMDAEGNMVGVITSSTISPTMSNAAICLALVRQGYFDLGTKLAIPAEGTTHLGVVTALPFIKPGLRLGSV